MVAVIFGIQGVGKSSLVNAILDRHKNFIRLYWGGASLEAAKTEGLANNIDEVRNLTIAEQKRLQMIVAKQFADQINSDRKANYIIETHAALKTPQGFMSGFAPEILAAIKPDIFFIVESHAIDIYHRRILDESRKRDHDKTVREIQLNLDATRWFATTFSVLTGANLMMIENVEDNLDVAINKVSEVLQEYLKSA